MICKSVEITVSLYDEKDTLKEQKVIILKNIPLTTAKKIKKNIKHKINTIITEDELYD